MCLFDSSGRDPGRSEPWTAIVLPVAGWAIERGMCLLDAGASRASSLTRAMLRPAVRYWASSLTPPSMGSIPVPVKWSAFDGTPNILRIDLFARPIVRRSRLIQDS